MEREKLQKYLDQNPFAKLRDVVAQLLYDEIISLDIMPGTKLNINQIAANLGISRTPVAEAVAQLCERGFVVTRPDAGGHFVLDLSMSDMINLYRVRAAIECEAAALCTERASSAVIAQLDTLANEFRDCVIKKDNHGMIETDMPFHSLIVTSSRDPYVIKCYNLLLPNLTMYQASMVEFISSSKDNPWSSSVIYNHTAIVAAIKMHIPDLARQAMSDHVTASLSYTMFSGGANSFHLKLSGKMGESNK
jgi:DNA-binding GntR family transcriptional regulator